MTFHDLIIMLSDILVLIANVTA